MYINLFKESKVYIIPKKNAGLGHGIPWLKTMERFLDDTLGYLAEYYKRENSESGFSGDKKLTGWKVSQKREDRIDTALFCGTIWHNLWSIINVFYYRFGYKVNLKDYYSGFEWSVHVPLEPKQKKILKALSVVTKK